MSQVWESRIHSTCVQIRSDNKSHHLTASANTTTTLTGHKFSRFRPTVYTQETSRTTKSQKKEKCYSVAWNRVHRIWSCFGNICCAISKLTTTNSWNEIRWKNCHVPIRHRSYSYTEV